MCTRPTQFQGIGQRYPGFIADLLGVWKAVVCWLFFIKMSTMVVTGPPVPYDMGRGEPDRVSANIRSLSRLDAEAVDRGRRRGRSLMHTPAWLLAFVKQRHNS